MEVEVKDPLKQAAILFETGQNAHQAGDLNKAIELYTAALKRNPALWQAEFQRGTAYLSLNRLAEAKASVGKVNEQLEQFADSPELRQMKSKARILEGEIALSESKPGEAEKAFRTALELNPQAGRARAGLAEVLLQGGKHADAAGEAKAAIEAGDERMSVILLQGEALTLARKYEDALPALNEVIKRDPKNAVALRYRAECHIARKDLGSATSDLRAANEIEPLMQTRLRLAGVLAQSRKFDEALEVYRLVLKEDPSNNEAKTAVAALMIESGKGAEAITELESLIKSEPGRADLRAQLAELYLPSSPEKSLEQYAAAGKLDPSSVNHKIGAGSALVKLKRYQEAIVVLKEAVASNPKEDIAYFAHTNLATAFFEMDDYQNAAREFIWILERQRDQKKAAITLYFLGICFDKLHDYEQALKAYEQFLSIASSENQLEVEKVKLRLPSLQKQIKLGKGKRKF